MKQLTIIIALALASCHKCEPPCREYVCTTIHTVYGRGTATKDTTGCLTAREVANLSAAAYISNDSVFHEVKCR